MHTIAVIGEKGGTGKSTVTIHLAVAAVLAGEDTAIIDLDPQSSAADWADQRTGQPEAVSVQPGRLERVLADLRNHNLGMVIVDTGRDASNAALTAARLADIVLIPVKPNGFDLRALARTVDVCRLANREGRAYLVPNAFPPRAPKFSAGLREALAEHGLEVCPVTIHERAAYRNTSLSFRTPMETDPAGPAAVEITSLYRWVRTLTD